jgi:PKD repeat protein
VPFARLARATPPKPRPWDTCAVTRTAVAALLLAACGGADLLLPGDGVPARIGILHGDGQFGRMGEPLAQPLVVEVTDSRGRPVNGVAVAFEFTSAGPGADIVPDSATTDANGEANAQLVLGNTIGPQTGQASVVAEGSRAPKTSFTVMAVPKNADGIAAVSGDDQTGAAGSKLRQPLVVEVTDARGNPISGVRIDWAAEGGGSVSDASNTTDENGRASVERTLGPTLGQQTTLASSEGRAGSPVTFTHTATAGSASSLTIVSGNNQTAAPGSRLPADLVVRLVDGEGNGVPGTAVTWVVGIGGGSVTPQNGTTDDQGRASAQWTLGPNPGQNRVDAVVSGVGIANFRATGTVNSIATTTTITSDSPDPSVSGTAFTVEFRVTSEGPTPTGSVTVTATDAQANCSGALQNGAGSCSLTLNRAGDRTLRATYSGGPGFNSSSTTAAHRVVPATPQNQEPHADYNWHCDGLTCHFTDNSSDPDGQVTGWSWNFGDGTTTSEREPTHNFPGPNNYTVTLTVTDNGGASNGSTATVDVHAPLPSGTTTTITGDDPDPSNPGVPITVSFTVASSSGQPTGSVVVSDQFGGGCSGNAPSGNCSYTPNGIGSRTLTATYQENSSFNGSSDTEQHTVAPPPNQPPVAVNDVYNTTEGGDHTLIVPASEGVLINDNDPERDPLAASVVGGPSSGRLNLRSDGSFDYTPNADFFGDDSFSYRASDPSGGSSTATVTIHVQPVNDSPRFSDVGGLTVLQDAGPQTVSGWAFGISPGAPNEADQVLTFNVIQNDNPSLFASGPAATRDGTSGTGTLTFTPALGVNGVANIVVVLKDNGGTANGGSDTSAPHPFTVTVQPLPVPPPSEGRIRR